MANPKLHKLTRLEDIARDLQLSIATISRSLADSPRVKQKTKDKVREHAKKMGYTPNYVAKSLRSGKTNILGVIIPRYDEPFFIEVCRGIDHYARKHDYRILISSSRNSIKHEIENLQSFEKGNVDGIIACFTHETHSFDHVYKLTEKNIPIVLFDNIDECIDGAGHVMIDDYKAAFDAVVQIIRSNSCPSIGFIGGTVSKSIFNKRYNGYLAALTKNGLQYDEKFILNCKSLHQEHEFYEIYNFLSKLDKLPEAFFCTTDNYAILCIKSLMKLGYKVPHDVQIMGFGNLHYSSMFSPELSCVSQPSFKMGEKTAEMLISKISKGYYLPDDKNMVILPTKLIQRETTL